MPHNCFTLPQSTQKPSNDPQDIPQTALQTQSKSCGPLAPRGQGPSWRTGIDFVSNQCGQAAKLRR